jgi:hypothetical protein
MADQPRRTTFGALLHRYREVAGLPQEAPVERAGISPRRQSWRTRVSARA